MRIALPVDADIVASLAAAAGESIVMVILPGRDPVAQALAVAAVGPLAVMRAPDTRVNAVIVAEGADRAAVDAAVRFLEQAASTTGQVLTVS